MKGVNYLAGIYESPYRRGWPQVEDEILTFIGRRIIESFDALAQDPMVEVAKDCGIRSDSQQQAPFTAAVAGFLEKFSSTGFEEILAVDESTWEFQSDAP